MAAARTPVVSAIGHEQDTPLLDLVADVRASTPTDAAKLVVPDVAEELVRVSQLRDRGRAVLVARLVREQQSLDALRARPALSDPAGALDQRTHEVASLRDRARRTLAHRLDRADDDLAHRLARVRGMSPLATLRRGYAVVADAEGHVLRSIDSLVSGDLLQVRVADGRITTHVSTTVLDPISIEQETR